MTGHAEPHPDSSPARWVLRQLTSISERALHHVHVNIVAEELVEVSFHGEDERLADCLRQVLGFRRVTPLRTDHPRGHGREAFATVTWESSTTPTRLALVWFTSPRTADRLAT